MPAEAVITGSSGQQVRPAQDPFALVKCVNTSGNTHRFTLADPSYPEANRRVVKYEISPGEEFDVPRCYAAPRHVHEDGHEAIGSVVEMLATGCVMVGSAKHRAWEAKQRTPESAEVAKRK